MTRRRSLLARVLRGVAVGLGALLLLAVLGVGGALWATLPPRQQTLRLAGLHHPVSVSIDDKGVPRIAAADLADAATATGYLHARDRMFQMELTRRVGSGRVSEIAGPAGLPIDRTMRTLGLRHLAEAAYPALPQATRALFDAYARGVNAAIASRGRFIAPEFLLLGRPEPWTPVDSLLWGRLMGLSLAGNWRVELDRLALSPRVPLARLLGLWPDQKDTAAPQAARAEPALSRLAARIDRAVPRFPDPFTLPDEASDEWAVDGAHSVTGAPLLAGDPHLAFGFPAIWYLLRIDVPGYSLAGATAPGIPFLVLGQNGHVAWTFTSSSADTQDLFVETPLPGGRYATPDGPRPFTLRREVIRVRGRPDTVLVVRATRHGPVVSDILPPADTENRVLAAAMENLLPEDAAPGLAALNQAGNVDDAGRAAALITTPVQNLLVADRSRIALFTTGRVPVRRSGDGSFPADGAGGAGDWIGQASGGALPTVVAPASGHLLNGNERTAPPGFPVFMGRDWPGAWRADRIRALLDAEPRHDVAGFVRMQTDITSAFAQAVLPLLLARPPHPAPGSVAARALALLGGWSGTMAMDQPQPLVFNAWMQRFVTDTLAQGEGPGGISGAAAPWEDVVALLLSPAGTIWCNGDCTPALARALDQASRDLAAAQGSDPSAWRWGVAHHAVFENAFLQAIPLLRRLGHREVPVPGDDSTLFRGGSGLLDDFGSRHGGAYRGVYDLGDPERSRFVVTPGQSGNWLSPDAWNLMQDWADGSTMTIVRTPRRVAATLSLVP